MTKIAVVTDSTSDLPNYIVKQYDIKVLPLRVVYKDKEYRDGVDIQPQEVYKNLPIEVPTTSLPSPQEIIETLDELEKKGYTDVIVLTISSGLSGTYNLIKTISQDYNKLNIKVIDSKGISMLFGFIVIEAAALALKNKSIDDIMNKIYEIRKRIKGCFVLKTLEYLRKGGRIGKVEGSVGEFFNIKPIIGINDDGVYYTMTKVRGRKKSISTIRSIIEENFKGKHFNLAILHGDAEKEANDLYESVKDIGKIKEYLVSQISPVLGVHSGPGMIGYVAYEV